MSAVIGGLVGALLCGVLVVATSADAATGDTAKLGEWNHAGKQTVFTSAAGTTVMIRNTKAGKIPLDLQATPGTPPLKVNRAAWIQNLNADLLDDYQAHQLVRVAHAESPNVDETGWGTGENTALTTTITAPTAGFLVINAQAQVGGNDRFYCLIEVDNVEVTGGRIFGQQTAGEGLCTSMGTKAVAAGVRTVTFIMGDRTDYTLDDAALSVIFIPFGATGNIGS
jgi:hypothetical protein